MTFPVIVKTSWAGYAVACPRCAAAAWALCVRTRGGAALLRKVHRERADAWRARTRRRLADGGGAGGGEP